jgi:hypothetical protein
MDLANVKQIHLTSKMFKNVKLVICLV